MGFKGSWVPLDNLTQIKLLMCSECEEIPTLEQLPNLKSLYLVGLMKVRFINSSFNNLWSLILDGLELKCLPKQLFYHNQNLSRLRIEMCPALSELPDGLDTLNFLKELTIKHCENLKSIGNPSGVGKYQGILRELKIEECRELVEFPSQVLESSAATVEILRLEGLRSLKNLPMLIDCLAKCPRLGVLTIKGVPNFMASGTIESWDLGRLKELEIDVSVEWLREISLGVRETAAGMLQFACSIILEGGGKLGMGAAINSI